MNGFPVFGWMQRVQHQSQVTMLDAVEQQLQNLKPLLQQLQQQAQPQLQMPPQQPPPPVMQPQEPGILGRPPLTTVAPGVAPRPIQLPLPGPPPLATDILEVGDQIDFLRSEI